MTERELYMQLGDLALTKFAEEIDEKTFNKKCHALVKKAGAEQGVRTANSTIKALDKTGLLPGLAKEYLNALKMTELKDGLTPSIPRLLLRGSKYNVGKILSGGAKTALAYAPILMAAASAGKKKDDIDEMLSDDYYQSL